MFVVIMVKALLNLFKSNLLNLPFLHLFPLKLLQLLELHFDLYPLLHRLLWWPRGVQLRKFASPVDVQKMKLLQFVQVKGKTERTSGHVQLKSPQFFDALLTTERPER